MDVLLAQPPFADSADMILTGDPPRPVKSSSLTRVPSRRPSRTVVSTRLHRGVPLSAGAVSATRQARSRPEPSRRRMPSCTSPGSVSARRLAPATSACALAGQ